MPFPKQNTVAILKSKILGWLRHCTQRILELLLR